VLQAFWLALQFFTRLPTPKLGEVTAEALGRSVLFYPLVGLVIGTLLALAAWVMTTLDSWVAGALLLTLWVWISGALHLDGLADSADAWIGGHGDRERTLEIMKDPRCGPVGVTAVVVLLLIKFAALAALLRADVATAVLLLIPMLARAAVLGLFATTDYVRPAGLGSAQSNHLPIKQVPWWLTGCALLTLMLLGWHGVVVLLAGGIGFLWLRRAMRLRIGGTTGDTAGALIEIMEALLLIVAVWVLV